MDDKERIQMQAREARATSIREHSVAKRKLQEEAETVTEEVTEATRLASTQTYEAYEPILKDIKADITIEKRRQDLPGYVSDDISKLRSTRQALQSEREAGRGDIRDQSKAALASIKSQLLSGETQIEASEKSALSSIESQEAEILAERAESFELDTGELVDKAKYNELSQEEKEYINTKGADKFNKWQEDKLDKFEAENIEIKPGEWADKKKWNTLSPSQQQEVMETGKYTEYSEFYAGAGRMAGSKDFSRKIIAASPGGARKLGSQEISAKIIGPTLGLGRMLGSKDISQRIIEASPGAARSLGSDVYSQTIFEASHTEILPDIWVGKKEWESLTIDQKESVKKTGEYTVATSPEEQFEEALKDKDIPVGSTYIGGTDEGGFEYTPPQGDITDITLAEHYKAETGIDLTPDTAFEAFKYYYDKAPGSQSELQSFYGEAVGMPRPSYGGTWGKLETIPGLSVIPYLRTAGEYAIPGIQSPVEEWSRHPDIQQIRQNYLTGMYNITSPWGGTAYVEPWIPAIKALSPEVTVGEIKPIEWVQTGMTIWAMQPGMKLLRSPLKVKMQTPITFPDSIPVIWTSTGKKLFNIPRIKFQSPLTPGGLKFRTPITGLKVTKPFIKLSVQSPIKTLNFKAGLQQAFKVRTPVTDIKFQRPISNVRTRAPITGTRDFLRGIKPQTPVVGPRSPVARLTTQAPRIRFQKPISIKTQKPILKVQKPIELIRTPIYGELAMAGARLEAIGLRSPALIQAPFRATFQSPIKDITWPVSAQFRTPWEKLQAPIRFDAPFPHIQSPITADFASPITAQFRSPIYDIKFPIKGMEFQRPITGTFNLPSISAQFRTPITGLRSPISGIQFRSPLVYEGLQSPFAGFGTSKMVKQARVAARESGEAASEVKYLTKLADDMDISSPGWTEVAGRLQAAQQRLMVADKRLIGMFDDLKVTPKQLRQLEERSGFTGLEALVKKAQGNATALKTAEANISRHYPGSSGWAKAMTNAQKTRIALGESTDDLLGKLKPRFEYSPHTNWDETLNFAERQVMKARENLGNAEKVHARAQSEPTAKWLRDAMDDLDAAESQLAGWKRASSEGAFAPEITSYGMSWEGGYSKGTGKAPLSPDTYKKLYDKMEEGWHQPNFWEMPSEGKTGGSGIGGSRVAVAERVDSPLSAVVTDRLQTLNRLQDLVPENTLVLSPIYELGSTMAYGVKGAPALIPSRLMMPIPLIPPANGIAGITHSTIGSVKGVAQVVSDLKVKPVTKSLAQGTVQTLETAQAKGIIGVSNSTIGTVKEVVQVVPDLLGSAQAKSITGVTTLPIGAVSGVEATAVEVSDFKAKSTVEPMPLGTAITAGELAAGAEVAIEPASMRAQRYSQEIAPSTVLVDKTLLADSPMSKQSSLLQDETVTRMKNLTANAPALQPKLTTATETLVKTKTITKPFPYTKPPPVPTKAMRGGFAFPIPPADGEEKAEGIKEYPPGTVTWRQGLFWKVIEPPYTAEKPESRFTPPAGARVAVGENSAYETIQTLGGEPTMDADIDLGIMDIEIRKGKHIRFTSSGELTDRGKRNKSKTTGMSIKTEPQFKRIRE